MMEKMTLEEYIQKKRDELASVSRRIVHGELHPIEGCRMVASIRNELPECDATVFDRIVLVESETEHFPMGEIREHYNAEVLRRLDQEMEDYLHDETGNIKEACRSIILFLGAQWSNR